MSVSNNRGKTPKWMVKIWEKPSFLMDDLGVFPYFWKHPNETLGLFRWKFVGSQLQDWLLLNSVKPSYDIIRRPWISGLWSWVPCLSHIYDIYLIYLSHRIHGTNGIFTYMKTFKINHSCR